MCLYTDITSGIIRLTHIGNGNPMNVTLCHLTIVPFVHNIVIQLRFNYTFFFSFAALRHNKVEYIICNRLTIERTAARKVSDDADRQAPVI
jgi:predicted metal-dependent RNase